MPGAAVAQRALELIADLSPVLYAEETVYLGTQHRTCHGSADPSTLHGSAKMKIWAPITASLQSRYGSLLPSQAGNSPHHRLGQDAQAYSTRRRKHRRHSVNRPDVQGVGRQSETEITPVHTNNSYNNTDAIRRQQTHPHVGAPTLTNETLETAEAKQKPSPPHSQTEQGNIRVCNQTQQGELAKDL